jgi:acyl-CoA hydrolase
MIPVEGHKGLYRDEKSNAIINCNDYEYQEYLKTKNSMIDEKNEIKNLKTELSEVKSLLTKLLENKS